MNVNDEKRYLLRSSEMYLPLRIDAAIYLRGVLKRSLNQLKDGDERQFIRDIYDRLCDACLDLTSYDNKPF